MAHLTPQFKFWTAGHTVVAYQLLLLIVFPFYCLYGQTPSLALILWSVGLFLVSEISITTGYHRLFAHRTYKAHPVVEFVLVFCASLTGQRSALRWAFEHRYHHSFVDTDRDPHSIAKGFWYAHWLWLFDPPIPIEEKVVADLLKKPLLVFQHKYENIWMFLPNAMAFFLVGWATQDFFGALVLAIGVRLFFNHHCTFCINSLTHCVGTRPFNKTISAVNNYLISFPTFGEGFHNFHHEFPNDYRNGIRWYDFDPTKWLIWSLSKVGLAKDLKRIKKGKNSNDASRPAATEPC